MLHSDSYSCSKTVRRVPLLPGRKVDLVGCWAKSCMSTHHVAIFVIVRPNEEETLSVRWGKLMFYS